MFIFTNLLNLMWCVTSNAFYAIMTTMKNGRNTVGQYISGNSGRPKGSRNKATIAIESLWCCQTNEPKHQYSFDEYVYEITKDRHSVRAASRLSLNVLRFESDLCELNRLWNEAWIEANFCRLCIRLNRSMALSRRRKGKCEFSTLLFAHRLVTCFFEQPSSLAAAL